MTNNKLFNKFVIAGISFFFCLLVGIRFCMFHNNKDLIEAGILFLSGILILIFGRKVLIYCLIVFVASVMHLDHKSLYASLLVFTITAFIKRKYLIPLTVIYHVNTVIVFCFSQNEPNVNVIIFYSICLIIFLLILFYPHIDKRRTLDLKEDEIKILEELVKGKQMKEIDFFSKNTLTEKLKNACKRNNLIDKNELLYLYKWECS